MRVTSRGVGLLLGAVLLIASGFGFGYPELTIIGATSGMGVVFALGYVAWRPGLSVAREVEPDRVMRGEPSEVTLSVGNASRLRAATLIAFDRCGNTSVPVPLVQLRAGRQSAVSYPVPTDRRGVITIGPLRVVRRDPLDALTMARSHGSTSTVWVYPKAYPLATMPPGVTRSLDGLVDHLPQGSIAFDTLREYVIGDELRHVHWRTTARIGRLMVREHLDTSLPRIVVLLDDRRGSHPVVSRSDETETFESACEAAASVVLASVQSDLPLVLQLVSGVTARVTGRCVNATVYLDLLAEASPTSDVLLDETISKLRHQRPGDTLIFITGQVSESDLGHMASLRGLYSTVVAVTFGSGSPVPASMDGMLVLSASDGQEFAREWDGMPSW